MMNSITRSKENKNKIPVWSVLVWLAIWEIVALCLKSDILLVSPIKVIRCLGEMIVTLPFWKAVGFTFLRIVLGFLIAALSGILFGALSYAYKPVRDLISVPVSVIKSTPVASFVILVLVWIPSRNLSVLISFLISFPAVYTNVLQGLMEMDEGLDEVAKVFRLPFSRRLRFIYTPQVMPYFRAACSLAFGMCWKAGIAAEIIGLPRGSMGEQLYEAKIYLNTPEMFAWTVTIIVVSFTFEKVLMTGLNHIMKRLEGR